MNNKAPISESEYEGVRYLVFDDLHSFLNEVEKSKRGVLKTNFNELSSHVNEFMAHISKVFGANSKEARSIAESLLFCGKCGAAFSDMFKGILIMGLSSDKISPLFGAYKNKGIPRECPKCGNGNDIILLYRIE